MAFSNCLPVPFALGIFILWSSLASSLPNDVREANFYKLEGKKFIGNLTKRHLTLDYWECLFLCLNTKKKDCFAFNYGASEGAYTCELINSEIKLEPGKIQEREGFVYYGMTAESLYRYLPCASSPCLHGKECITEPTHGMYSCECPLKNIGLTFVDDRCTVDMQKISKGTMKERVSLTNVHGMKLNFFEAEKLCTLLNASLASFDQLFAAWEAGLHVCVHGWINDGTMAFPIQEKSVACGNQVGVVVFPLQDKLNSRYSVWCYYN